MSDAPVVDAVERSKQFLQRLIKEDFAGAVAEFEPDLQAQMDAQKLASVWSGLLGQVGALTSADEPHVGVVNGLTMSGMKCQFARAPLELRLTFSPEGKIKGVHFVPIPATAGK